MREIVFGWLQDIAFYTLLMEVVLHVLPEQEQKTILLRFYKGLTQQQCARILGVSQVQVSRLEKRALDRLRRDMG